ncbi:MAG: hypothetical protein IT249_18295 [Chitinophagaceae bacterium]|nr:hypothetical protein [Chitinophagaceae bacterium]
MELIIDFDNIQDSSKKKFLLSTLKFLGIKFKTSENPQTLEEYNEDIEAGNAEIEMDDFISAEDLKREAAKW